MVFPQLTEPRETLEKTYRSYLAEFSERQERLIPCVLEYDARDFAALVRRLLNEAKGIGLPQDYVPASTFWLVDEQRTIVGVAHLRQSLTPALEREGGHIGYSVRPTKRKEGHGTALLRMVLLRAKAMGIARALLTCDRTNLASARVIQNNAGILDSEVPRKDGQGTIQRYWIDLA